MDRIIFNHDAETIGISLGIPPGREDEISDALNKMGDEILKEANSVNFPDSTALERFMSLAKNNTERLYIAYMCGRFVEWIDWRTRLFIQNQ